MAPTYYTVLADKDGCPVKYCQPLDGDGLAYWRVRTFRQKPPFASPGEASGVFEAWLGERGVPSSLDPQQFQAKVRALHQRCPTGRRRRKRWCALVDPRMQVMQQGGRHP